MNNILEVRNLEQKFNLTKGLLDKLKFENGRIKRESVIVHAVNDISFDVKRGSVFSLVGESGCGKSTTARTIIKLLEPK
ncbi:MAG: ATP-binding cassette domain-containing protein, partial [Spirochaetaceae bacterium]